MQWLQLQPLKNANPDPKKFPQFNDELRAAMLTETKLFFAELIREDRRILDILERLLAAEFLQHPLIVRVGVRIAQLFDRRH